MPAPQMTFLPNPVIPQQPMPIFKKEEVKKVEKKVEKPKDFASMMSNFEKVALDEK